MLLRQDCDAKDISVNNYLCVHQLPRRFESFIVYYQLGCGRLGMVQCIGESNVMFVVFNKNIFLCFQSKQIKEGKTVKI